MTSPGVETSWANHYKLGYHNQWFTWRTSSNSRFDWMTDGCGRMPMGLTRESINTAKILTEKYGIENITLMYSGGRDSEIVLLSFIAAGKIPRLVFLDYGENQYDLAQAQAVTKFYRLNLEILQLPAKEMLNSGEAREVCARYQCGQVGLSFYLKTLEELCKSSYVIIGDDPYLEKIVDPLEGKNDDWYFVIREWTYAYWKVFLKAGVHGCPCFITYTPELLLSYFDDPMIRWMREKSDLTSFNQVKYQLFKERFFTRDRAKSSGMEMFNSLILAQNDLFLSERPEFFTPDLLVPYAEVHHQLTRFIHDEYQATRPN